jgi:hypothetical protein
LDIIDVAADANATLRLPLDAEKRDTMAKTARCAGINSRAGGNAVALLMF